MPEQPSLFTASDLQGCYTVTPTASPQMSAKTLQAWKQRVFEYQQRLKISPVVQQGSLFAVSPTADEIAVSIDPFSLPQQNTAFWRWQYEDAGVAALYFVIDAHLPILLYIGETVHSNQRWKGEHGCKSYILNYVSVHHAHQLPVAVNISFYNWAPEITRDRQQIESALINHWRSPFNKENWAFWGTPFTKRK